MAVVQTLRSMTLGNQTNKMYTMIQQHSPAQNNCVIVTTIPNNGGHPSATATALQQVSTKGIIQNVTGKRSMGPTTERTTVVVNSTNIANNNNNNNNNDSMIRCKRKINFAHHMPYGSSGPGQPASVARRNARERNRVKQVNNGFATLRQHIPASVAAALSTSNSNGGRGASKKLSKVETLRMAVEYIRSLQQMIQDHEAEMKSTNSTVGAVSVSHELENQYYASSPESTTVQLTQLGHILQQTPPCSESSASPTPSYSSEGSISTPSTYAPLTVYQTTDGYENYEPMSPEDEELLDVISWWQQQ